MIGGQVFGSVKMNGKQLPWDVDLDVDVSKKQWESVTKYVIPALQKKLKLSWGQNLFRKKKIFEQINKHADKKNLNLWFALTLIKVEVRQSVQMVTYVKLGKKSFTLEWTFLAVLALIFILIKKKLTDAARRLKNLLVQFYAPFFAYFSISFKLAVS